jgi:hypothetical protein
MKNIGQREEIGYRGEDDPGGVVGRFQGEREVEGVGLA